MPESRRACLRLLIFAGAGIIAKPLRAANIKTMINFTEPEIAGRTRIVNDDVMGGRSDSHVVADPQGLIFSGTVSLENRGGFASVRCPVQFPPGISALALTMRGDDQRYQLLLRTELSTFAPLYKASFVASADWTICEFHAQDFDASFRGRPVAAPPLVFSNVRELGILIADNQAGDFRLQLRSLQAR